MPEYTYTGNKVKFDIQLGILEMQSEANLLLDRLEIEYQKLLASGTPVKLAQETILGWIENEESFFKTYLGKQKALIRTMEKELVARPAKAFGEENPDVKFNWVLGLVKTQHCSDCLTLSKMEAMTLDEWRTLGFGLPREGQTECSYGCQCMLLPIEG